MSFKVYVEIDLLCIQKCEVAAFVFKRWDRRSRENLIASTSPCNDVQVVGLST